ncbi:MAG: phosphoribosyltransferase [Bacteroidia bacterium]
MQFKDRKDAALQLIPLLEKYRNEKSVILAIPRGGVPLAYHIAKEFNFPVELLMTKKIGHPSNPELAIGAVTPEDHIIDEQFNISPTYFEQKVRNIQVDLAEKYKRFMGNVKPVSFTDKIIIIVDDGVATGNTILSAIKMLRKQNPKKIVVAVPVAPPETARKILNAVDDFICVYIPDDFMAVGYHYIDFSEVSDETVIELLDELKAVKH